MACVDPDTVVVKPGVSLTSPHDIFFSVSFILRQGLPSCCPIWPPAATAYLLPLGPSCRVALSQWLHQCALTSSHWPGWLPVLLNTMPPSSAVHVWSYPFSSPGTEWIRSNQTRVKDKWFHNDKSRVLPKEEIRDTRLALQLMSSVLWHAWDSTEKLAACLKWSDRK